MSWAQRLKRVFKIEIETCEIFGGPMKVSAAIEDPALIKRILRTARMPAHTPNTRPAPRRNSPCPA